MWFAPTLELNLSARIASGPTVRYQIRPATVAIRSERINATRHLGAIIVSSEAEASPGLLLA
jgi:hypothetical protein